ncbi:DegT/DnrJ/EryC1/StrS family aminotransferase [Xylophilus sp. GW821-FHT01B05]
MNAPVPFDKPAGFAPVYVTRPSLPPLEEFIPFLERIWESGILTNNGPYHQELEQRLGEYLGVEHVSLFSNCTIALITALQALRVTGEVITTPYSFVATAHSILWNGIRPVFADIDPATLNLDPAAVEAAITPQTTAIMPVHCYGRPCDVQAIQKIADNYGLKVIYDAAHAFGVRDAGGSVLRHGDLSVVSFHATKVFTTFEGGAIISPDAKTKQRVDYLKNFGFANEVTVVAPGINGKMSEVNAAFGLLQLRGIDQSLAKRRDIAREYSRGLAGLPGITCVTRDVVESINNSYFPIMVDDAYGISRDELYRLLKEGGIYARRYFYPLITEFPMYRGLPSAAASALPVARWAADGVICLPIYPDLPMSIVESIVRTVRECGHA